MSVRQVWIATCSRCGCESRIAADRGQVIERLLDAGWRVREGGEETICRACKTGIAPPAQPASWNPRGLEDLAVTVAEEPLEATADQAVSLILARNLVAEWYAKVMRASERALLEWFAADPDARQVGLTIGELRYYPARPLPTRKPRHLPTAFVRGVEALVGPDLHRATMGDVDAYERLLRALSDVAEKLLSADALKPGANHEVLGDAYGELWEEKWRDKLADGPASKRLGVENVRFVEAAKRRRQWTAGGGDEKPRDAGQPGGCLEISDRRAGE